MLDGFGDVFLFASQVLGSLFICFVVISCSMDGARYVFTEVVWYVFSWFARGADARHQRTRMRARAARPSGPRIQRVWGESISGNVSTRLVSAVEDSLTPASCATIRRSAVAVRCRRVSRGPRWLFRYRSPPVFLTAWTCRAAWAPGPGSLAL